MTRNDKKAPAIGGSFSGAHYQGDIVLAGCCEDPDFRIRAPCRFEASENAVLAATLRELQSGIVMKRCRECGYRAQGRGDLCLF